MKQLVLFVGVLSLTKSVPVEAFSASDVTKRSLSTGIRRSKTFLQQWHQLAKPTNEFREENVDKGIISSQLRRSIFIASASLAVSTYLATSSPNIPYAEAAVGSLPEYANTNAILQGLTIKVADPSQEQAMINFLQDGFDFQILRKRIRGSQSETWFGFGPEQLSIPSDFVLPVSSFTKYGGHASIHLVYDSALTNPLYRIGDTLDANSSIAFLQCGVPVYRISQMVRNGGTVTDAYGYVSVVSPAGLPMRGIVGVAPDPIMMVAIRCNSVKASREFYENIGFVEQAYPVCRPSQGIFEPVQPPGSVYLAPTPNGVGILLLPTTKRRSTVVPNPSVDSLHIVYTPSQSTNDDGTESLRVTDPSGIALDFQSVQSFDAEERVTR